MPSSREAKNDDAPDPLHPPAAVTVPPDTLRRYAGTYRFGPRAVLQIALDEGHLTGLALDHRVFAFNGASPHPLTAMSDTEFYLSGRYPVRITFQVADGNVTGAVLNPGRWEQASVAFSPP